MFWIHWRCFMFILFIYSRWSCFPVFGILNLKKVFVGDRLRKIPKSWVMLGHAPNPWYKLHMMVPSQWCLLVYKAHENIHELVRWRFPVPWGELPAPSNFPPLLFSSATERRTAALGAPSCMGTLWGPLQMCFATYHCSRSWCEDQHLLIECWLVVWLPFFIFPYIGNNHPNWLIFFRGVQTTNQNVVAHANQMEIQADSCHLFRVCPNPIGQY